MLNDSSMTPLCLDILLLLGVGHLTLDLSRPWEVERDLEVLPPSPVDSAS